MRTTYKLDIIIFLLTASITGGCKKFVSINPPVTQLVTTSVFNDNTTATAAQTVLYAQMASDPYSLDNMTGLSSDELKSYSGDPGTIALYTNSLTATVNVPYVWASAYNYIYEVNAVLEGLQNGNVNPAVKQQLMGEAKFVRAFWYFYLASLYGGGPIITTTDYKKNTEMVRAPQMQVYQQVIGDLRDAATLLNANYVDFSDTAITKDRVRPTKWAALALMAKTYLFSGDFVRADSTSTAVINNTALFSLQSSLDSVFKRNNPEAIWQIVPVGGVGYTQEGYFFTLTGAPGNINTATLSDSLLTAFENGDQRKARWVGSVKSNNKTYYYSSKYKANTGTSTTLTEYSMVLRLAEQYLIRAEARAQGAGTGINGALDDLNKIRNRAGLPNYAGATDKSSVLNAILRERRVELFLEAHRWLDLRRAGIIDATMNAFTSSKGSSWSSYQQLYPIPLSDIQTSNMSQNQGY